MCRHTGLKETCFGVVKNYEVGIEYAIIGREGKKLGKSMGKRLKARL